MGHASAHTHHSICQSAAPGLWVLPHRIMHDYGVRMAMHGPPGQYCGMPDPPCLSKTSVILVSIILTLVNRFVSVRRIGCQE